MYPVVIAIGEHLVSTALLRERFACELSHCKGFCCVEGDSGAPLEAQEIPILEAEYAAYAPFMSAGGREAVQTLGFGLRDVDGDWVTPLIGGAECAYTHFDENGICFCAIEQAFLAGKTRFRKPSSCWLYPIRIQELSDGLALNYHEWPLCAGACKRGEQENIPVYQFLREAIIARFGEAFYQELDVAASLLDEVWAQ